MQYCVLFGILAFIWSKTHTLWDRERKIVMLILTWKRFYYTRTHTQCLHWQFGPTRAGMVSLSVCAIALLRILLNNIRWWWTIEKWNVYKRIIFLSWFLSLAMECENQLERKTKKFLLKRISLVHELSTRYCCSMDKFSIWHWSVEYNVSWILYAQFISYHIISYHSCLRLNGVHFFLFSSVSVITSRQTNERTSKWNRQRVRDKWNIRTLDRWYAIHVHLKFPEKRIKIECQAYMNRQNLHEIQEWARTRCDAKIK